MIGEITMNIIGKQCEQGYNFYEEGHKIYTMTNQSEKGLIRLTLLNQLGYPVYEVFQLVSWKDRFRKNKYDFAIYEGEEKIAEFTSLKNGYEVEIFGVFYYLETGTYEDKACVYVKKNLGDPDIYILDEDIELRLKYGRNHALHICFAYLFNHYLCK